MTTSPHLNRSAGALVAIMLFAAVLALVFFTRRLPDQAEQPTVGSQPARFRVAMLLPAPVEGNPWNAAGRQGMEAVARELGAQTTLSPGLKPGDYVPFFERYAAEGYDLVIGNGAQFIAAAEYVASHHPRTKFMIVGAYGGNNANLGAVSFREGELGYLAGAAAALKSQSGRVAYVGGMPYAHMREKAGAFTLGAQAVNPHVDVTVRFLDTWTDRAAGERVGSELLDQGVDVLALDADVADEPVFELATARQRWVIGWVEDEHERAPGSVLTSGIQRNSVLILEGARLALAGRWEGRQYKFGMHAGAQELAPFRGSFDQAAVLRLREMSRQILSGRIETGP